MKMDKKELFNIAEQYFSYFENKDIDSLSRMFSNEVKLFDPIVKHVHGIENVLFVNKEIFDSASYIKIMSKVIYIDAFSDNIIAQLEIHFDNKSINVVDIISLDSKNKISSIMAYFDSKQIL